jgi:peroxiredoxin
MSLVAAAACLGAGPEEPLGAGDKAPDFTLKTPDERTITLSDLGRDKTVLVNFYFLDNAFSRQEHAELQKLYTKHKDRGLEIVAVNGGKRDTSDLIK